MARFPLKMSYFLALVSKSMVLHRNFIILGQIIILVAILVGNKSQSCDIGDINLDTGIGTGNSIGFGDDFVS